MSKEAMKLALEALKNSVDSVSNEAREAESLYGKYPSRLARVQGLVALEVAHQTAIKVLKEALAKQERCKYPNCDYPCTNLPDCQEQKPVKWSDYESDGVHHNKPSLAKQEQGVPEVGFGNIKQEQGEPDYKTLAIQLQQRTWVGLTDEEAQWLYDNCRTPSNLIDMTEAKLKEKNT
jgi:hypothetical protein